MSPILIQEALGKLRKSRYLECVRQLSLFTGSLHEIAHGSRKLALALARNWLAASEECCRSISRHLSQIPYMCLPARIPPGQAAQGSAELGTILDELKAVQEEFDDVAFNAEEGALCAITEPITLEDTYLGPFRIALYLDKLQEMRPQDPVLRDRRRAASRGQRRGHHAPPREQ